MKIFFKVLLAFVELVAVAMATPLAELQKRDLQHTRGLWSCTALTQSSLTPGMNLAALCETSARDGTYASNLINLNHCVTNYDGNLQVSGLSSTLDFTHANIYVIYSQQRSK